MKKASVHQMPRGAGGAFERPPEERAGDELFERIRLRLEELVSYSSHYLSSRSDSMRLSLYSAALWAVLGVLGAIAGIAILFTAGARLVQGIAEGLTALTGYSWLGNLLTGLLLLGAAGGAGFYFVKKLIGAKQAHFVRKYEEVERRERVRFGRSASERSAGH